MEETGNNDSNENKKKESEAKRILERRITNAKTLEFFVERFMEYTSDNQKYKEILEPSMKKFEDYMEANFPDKKMSISKIVGCGLGFLATNPVFSIHEFAEAGAKLSSKETLQFTKEVMKAIAKPSIREKIFPYIATVGYKVVLHLKNKDNNLKKAIAERVEDMEDVIGAGIIKSISAKRIQPTEKALMMIEKMEDMGIYFDKEGTVEDTKGMLEHERKLKADERRGSKKNTSGKGPEGFPAASENLN